jgi:hypothetical protein
MCLIYKDPPVCSNWDFNIYRGIYNCQFLTYGIRGACHAGVIIGTTENDIIINNPWLGSEYFISHEVFAPAWELEYNQAILLDPNPQSKLGEQRLIEAKSQPSEMERC